MALLKSTMGFGVITRVDLLIHPQSETQVIHRIDSTELEKLLSLAGFTARSHGAPNQLFIVKHLRGNSRKKKSAKLWSLFVVWDPDARSQSLFLDRVRFRGLQAQQETVSKVDIIHELSPQRREDCVRIPALVSEDLQEALERTRRRWVIAFKSAHDLYLWPAHERKSEPEDPVDAWCKNQRATTADHCSALRDQLLSALDPHGLMHLIGAETNSVFDSKNHQEE